MKESLMKKSVSKVSQKQKAEITALRAMPDYEIDTRDIPEQKNWDGAVRGAFYRPVKKQLTLRLDADLVEWFRRQTPNGEGYQTSINQALREYVKAHQVRR